MPGLIFFNLDGTLIDSHLDLAGAVNHIRASMGLEPADAEDRIVQYSGPGVINQARRAIADPGIDFDTALDRMKRFYAEHIAATLRLYPGVRAGLAELHQSGVKLAVVTNRGTADATALLERFGIAADIDKVVGGDCDYPLKPAPDALLAVQAAFDQPKERCWFFGDSAFDLEAARCAGFRRVFARYGGGDPGKETAEFEVGSFAEFVTAIRGF